MLGKGRTGEDWFVFPGLDQMVGEAQVEYCCLSLATRVMTKKLSVLGIRHKFVSCGLRVLAARTKTSCEGSTTYLPPLSADPDVSGIERFHLSRPKMSRCAYFPHISQLGRVVVKFKFTVSVKLCYAP
jgi:hypothetical protein